MQSHAAGVTDQGLSEARIRSEERFQLKSFYKKSTSSANYLQNVLQRVVCKKLPKSMKERTNKHQKSLKSSVAPTIFLQIINFVTENATLSIVLSDRIFFYIEPVAVLFISISSPYLASCFSIHLQQNLLINSRG